MATQLITIPLVDDWKRQLLLPPKGLLKLRPTATTTNRGWNARLVEEVVHLWMTSTCHSFKNHRLVLNRRRMNKMGCHDNPEPATIQRMTNVDHGAG